MWLQATRELLSTSIGRANHLLLNETTKERGFTCDEFALVGSGKGHTATGLFGILVATSTHESLQKKATGIMHKLLELVYQKHGKATLDEARAATTAATAAATAAAMASTHTAATALNDSEDIDAIMALMDIPEGADNMGVSDIPEGADVADTAPANTPPASGTSITPPAVATVPVPDTFLRSLTSMLESVVIPLCKARYPKGQHLTRTSPSLWTKCIECLGWGAVLLCASASTPLEKFISYGSCWPLFADQIKEQRQHQVKLLAITARAGLGDKLARVRQSQIT